jgi:hypothetical protein
VRSLSTGSSLLIGKTRALRVTGSNAAWGRNYSKEFGKWMTEDHFDRMPKSTRSVAIELAENEQAITGWRNGLPERQRQRLIHPLSAPLAGRHATQPSDKSPNDFKRTDRTQFISDAMAAWRRFVLSVEVLPPDQQRQLWREAQARADLGLSQDQDTEADLPPAWSALQSEAHRATYGESPSVIRASEIATAYAPGMAAIVGSRPTATATPAGCAPLHAGDRIC